MYKVDIKYYFCFKLHMERELRENLDIDWEQYKKTIFRGVKTNLPYIICLTLACYVICKKTKSNYYKGIFTLGFVMFVGYYSHFLSHYTRLSKRKKTNSKNYILNKMTDFIIYNYNFHHKIHHNSKINKTKYHQYKELEQNLITQGGWLIILYATFKFIETHINLWIVVFWAVLYSSIHLINYSVYEVSQHSDHHSDITINLGMPNLVDYTLNLSFYKNKNKTNKEKSSSSNILPKLSFI